MGRLDVIWGEALSTGRLDVIWGEALSTGGQTSRTDESRGYMVYWGV